MAEMLVVRERAGVLTRAMQRHSCALTSEGGAKCWGSNWYNRLGDGTMESRYTPVSVVGLSSGVTSIAVGQVRCKRVGRICDVYLVCEKDGVDLICMCCDEWMLLRWLRCLL